jgi:hypothetical protein
MLCRRFAAALAVAALSLCLAAPTRADLSPIETSGDPQAGSTLNVAGGILDTLYGLGNLTRVDDFGANINGLGLDQIWGFIGASADILVQAKYAGDTNDFGGLNGPGYNTFTQLGTISSTAPGGANGFLVEFTNVNTAFADVVSADTIRIYGPGNTPPPSPFSDPLALGISNGTGVFSSVQGVNAPSPGGRTDHMVTYKITGNITGKGNYVIAFEDRTEGDYDYNDAVLEISGLQPVPEPSTFAIAGLGALGLIGYGIRRRRGA